MAFDSFVNLFTNLQTVLGYISYVAPFLLFLLLVVLVPGLWLAYIQAYYLKISTKFVLLELRPPREVVKTPRAMEQVFTSIHSLGSGPDLKFPTVLNEKWWNGEVVYPYSMEIASFGGEVHFFIWIPEKHRNIIEAAFYSNYPDMQVKEADNYLDRLPRTFGELKKRGYELFGTEFLLAHKKETKDKIKLNYDIYPIRTYFDFEAVAEEKELDPISGIMEVLAKIRPQDTIWLQMIIQPAVEGERGRIEKEGGLVLAEMKRMARSVKNLETGEIHMVMPSPGESETMRAIERKLSKPMFNAVVRTIYMGPKEGFSSNFGQRGIISAFNQYSSETYNRFRNNGKVWSRANMWYPPFIFPKRRLLGLKERIIANYRERRFYYETRLAWILQMHVSNFGVGGKIMTLNAEELATLFHLPTIMAPTGSIMVKEEARKAGPPAGLPIYGEEGDELPGIK
ncbi:MAG: hypothetical protein AAB972_01625 [Patescibacteria group bacterium]